MGWVIPLLNAIAGLPKALELLESFAAQVIQWYVEQQTQKTLGAVADAFALAARAKDQKERLDAAEAMRSALSRDRHFS